MIGAVGDDPLAEEALAGLVEAGVELDVERKGQTGVALIYVDAEGENEIAVFSGRERRRDAARGRGRRLCQLEVPDEVVYAAAAKASFFALNAAPARELDLEPDLLVVNRFEHEVDEAREARRRDLRRRGRGALRERQAGGRLGVADDRRRSTGPAPATRSLRACSSGLLEERPYEEALRRACMAGALRRREDRRPALASRRDRRRGLAEEERLMATPILIDCDPGHDDAVALMLAVASPEVELVGVTTVVGQPDASRRRP